MNGTSTSLEKRTRAQVCVAANYWPVNAEKLNFPSYFRILDVFSERFLGKLWWKSAHCRLGPAGQFSLVSASVAIV